MKIFYTNKFKEVLTKPYKQIELGKYKLRGGNNTGFNELTSDNIESRQFLSTTSPTSTGDEENYYTAYYKRCEVLYIHVILTNVKSYLKHITSFTLTEKDCII